MSLKVSPILAAAQVRAAYRTFLKVLFFGKWKTGKSKNLAFMVQSYLRDYPDKEVVVIDCGGGGIIPYLPLGHERLNVFTLFPAGVKAEEAVTDKKVVERAVAIANEAFKVVRHNDGTVSALALDEFDDLWKVVTQHEELRLGVEELKGGQWRWPIGIWQEYLFTVQRFNGAVAATAKHSDAEFSEKKTPAGGDGGLDIKKQDVPAIQKRTGYTIDLIVKCECVLDAMNRPTSKFTLRLDGHRRPDVIPPKEMYNGMSWTFDSRTPENTWDRIFKPWAELWSQGVKVEDVGGLIDQQTLEKAAAEAVAGARHEVVGEALLAFQRAASLPALRAAYEAVSPEKGRLTAEQWAAVEGAKERRKAELAGKGAA